MSGVVNILRHEKKIALWYMILSIITIGVFIPFAFFYMVSRSKKKSYLYKGIFHSLTVCCILMICFFVNQLNGFVITLLVVYLGASLFSLYDSQKIYFNDLRVSSSLGNNDVYDTLSLSINPDILNFVSSLQSYKERIKQVAITNNIGKIIDLVILMKNKDANKAGLFEARYGKTIIDLLQYYTDLEMLQVSDDKLIEAKWQIESVLNTSVEAFELELTGLLSPDLRMLDTQTETLLQNLRTKGLIE